MIRLPHFGGYRRPSTNSGSYLDYIVNEMMKPSTMGIDGLLGVFRHPTGNDDPEQKYQTLLFDSANLAQAYHSINREACKRIPFVSAKD